MTAMQPARICVDLHLHTLHSGDCHTSLEAIIAAVQRRGLGAIAVTDHNRLGGALALRHIAPFPVIVGEEIKTAEGEILAYYLEEEIPKGLSLEETIARVRAQGGLLSVSHPFDRSRGGVLKREALLRIVDQLDMIEVFNSRCFFSDENTQALEFANAHGLPGTGGSDAHIPAELGNAYIEMPPFRNKEEFLAGVRVGKVYGKRSSPLVHVASTVSKFRKRLGI
ncbi:MAG: PHP domain-containing protein [Chloroflexi bacterium]|nr:PHP domain-containing protein [Chloroflexota bacterium]